jgi:hypothetical protein
MNECLLAYYNGELRREFRGDVQCSLRVAAVPSRRLPSGAQLGGPTG